FLLIVGKSRRGLDLRHPVSQDLADPVFFGTEPTGVQTVLDRPAECEHTDGKNRQADEDLVKSERGLDAYTWRHKPRPQLGRQARNNSPSSHHLSPDNSPPPFRNFAMAIKSIPPSLPPLMRPG